MSIGSFVVRVRASIATTLLVSELHQGKSHFGTTYSICERRSSSNAKLMLITSITNTIPLFTHLGIDVLLNFEHQCVSQIVWSASSTNFHNCVWGYSSSVLRTFYVLDRLNYRYSICDRTYLTTIDETSVTLNRSVVKNLFVLCSTFVLHSIIYVWLDPHEQVSSFWEDEQLMLA